MTNTFPQFLMIIFVLTGLLGAVPVTGQAMDAAQLGELEEKIIERPYYSYRRELYRKYAVEMLAQGTPERGLRIVGRSLHGAFSKGSNQLNSRSRRQAYLYAADAYIILRRAHQAGHRLAMDEKTLRWLFSSARELRAFLNVLSPQDDFAKGWKIIETLYEHDPQGRRYLRRLILAMSMVWDQPRPVMHSQMGGQGLPYKADIKQRYDYFKTLYTDRQAELQYRSLSTAALMFVVDTPVPVDELIWAREKVDGSVRSWGDKFTEIDYAHSRIARQQFQWSKGPYTLEAIKKHGGICVEQGYYATLTARAHGIPALFFVGHGRRGPHAWMGFMQARGRWTLDVGRYEQDKYATGHAVNPQTGQPMTDHDVTYNCDRASNPSRFQNAAAYARLAMVLAELGFFEAASNAASRSAAQLPIYERPWKIQEGLLRQENKVEELMQLLDRKAKAFSDYPDFVADIRQKQAKMLVAAGMEDRARHFLQRHKSLIARHRDDLKRFLATEQIRVAYETGDYNDARRQFERLLREQKEEGSKMLWLLESYIEFSRRTDQETQAASFLKGYIKSLTRRHRGTGNRLVLLQLLARAYRNADMLDAATRIERDLQ